MSVRWDDRRNRFIVDYYPEGRKGKRLRITLPQTVKDLGMAQTIEQDLRNPSERSEIHPDNHSTVSEVFPLYLDYCKLHREESTYDNVKWTYEKKLLPHLGQFKVTTIDKGHTTVYKRLRKEDGVKNRTINKEMAYFMGFLKWCRQEYRIDVKQFRYEEMKEDKPIMLVLSLKETVELILNAELLYRVLFLALFALGLRFNECTHLKWEDLDEANKVIIARGKGSKERLLPVSEWLLHALNSIKPDPAEGLIFRSVVTGGRIRNLKTAIARACRKAGIKKRVYPHLLRHSLATHFMDNNVNIKIIQSWLGHAKESTTADIYTHAEINHLRSVQKQLDTQLDRHFTRDDFQPEPPPKKKRTYTVSQKALKQRQEAVVKARAARRVSIDNEEQNPEL